MNLTHEETYAVTRNLPKGAVIVKAERIESIPRPGRGFVSKRANISYIYKGRPCVSNLSCVFTGKR